MMGIKEKELEGCDVKDVKNPELWRGENQLGHILMSVRKKLQVETKK